MTVLVRALRPVSATVVHALARAAAVLGDRATPDLPLGPLTTYRVGGAAARSLLRRWIFDGDVIFERIREELRAGKSVIASNTSLKPVSVTMCTPSVRASHPRRATDDRDTTLDQWKRPPPRDSSPSGTTARAAYRRGRG